MGVTLTIDQHIARVVIDRPEALNAMNESVLVQMKQAVDSIQNNENVRVAIFMGGGVKSFVAGADINYMFSMTPLEGEKWGKFGQSVFTAISELRCPTIAVIQGYALGGGTELAISCDLRIASEKACFAQPEVKLGIIPGFGGTQRLTRLIGPGYAKQMILTGNQFSALQALAMGLVNEVVSHDRLIERVDALAQSIASRSPNGIRLAKEAIEHGLQGSLNEGLQLEAALFGLCFASPEQREGMTAFVEKRKPKF
ncbi:enoyl-CoA hydratase/isomerase family protein [Desulfosporosinus nitroreducens]|uniref:enoyl-CoA hydratase/isomerase family protein n=1 Tax=Desulfosporosinus nitroreducens TaxID=2018668 RepID=UPI00207C86F6|nr:enoyl-CoA hydratase-related protein [Desulfosporosinus nitroreducens]MCO1604402.1 enoyl-CoA hydratase-related protein [Desulfosporosinus nitroreducens]